MSEGAQGGEGRIRSVGRRLRPVGIGGLAAAVLVVLVMGTAAAAPAVMTAVTTKYVAPYAGGGIGDLENYATGCGSSASVSKLPDFNATSGLGTVAAKVASKNCGTTPSNRTLLMTLVYVAPTFTTTAGSHNLTENWVLTFTAKLAATGTTSHPASAFFEVIAFEEFLDLSNSTSVGSAAALAATQEITTGSYSHTFTKVSVKTSVVASLKKSTNYDYDAEVEVFLVSSVASGGTSASASVTMSNGANLKSVTFS